MKKRVLMLVLTTVLMLSFCVHSYAANVAVYNKVSSGRTVNGVVISATACAYKTNAEGILLMQNNSSSYVPVLVNIQITNGTDSAQLVQNLAFNIDAESPMDAGIYNIENFSPDLTLTHDTNVYGTFTVVPSNEFSYNNGIVLPSHSSLYLVAEVQIWREYSSSNQAFVNFQLNGITITSAVTASIIDISTNDAVDLSPVINAINNLDTTVEDNLTAIESIVSIMKNCLDDALNYYQDILDAVTYTGNSPNYDNVARVYKGIDVRPYDGTIYVIRVYRGNARYVTYDFETNSSSDTLLNAGTKYYPLMIFIQYVNINNNYMRSYYLNQINNVLPNGYNENLTIDYFNSSLYESVVPLSNKNLNFKFKNIINNYYSPIPNGNHTTLMIGKIVVRNEDNITFDEINFDNWNYGIDYVPINGYYPLNEYTILRDIYLGVANTNGTNTASSSAGSLNNSVAGVHQQEEQFYTQNSQALESSGITHYSFDNDSTTALNVARTLFERLWTALNPYTIVYTFSMLLTLALAIIRYTNSRKAKKE